LKYTTDNGNDTAEFSQPEKECLTGEQSFVFSSSMLYRPCQQHGDAVEDHKKAPKTKHFNYMQQCRSHPSTKN
jgi:hypothetical protein